MYYMKMTNHTNNEWLHRRGQMFKIRICIGNAVLNTFSSCSVCLVFGKTS